MADLKKVREQLPGVSDTVYLNTGTCGPMPLKTYEAMAEDLKTDLTRARIDSQHFPKIGEARARVREATAKLVKADPSEIAITSSTTDGMYLAIMGYRWQAGDEILLSNIEHPGGMAPSFLAKRRYGVNTRVVDIGLGGGDPADIVKKFEQAISPRTRMIVISHVSYTTGAKLPLKEICDMAHAHNVLVVADAAQTFGAVDLDLPALGVDVYAGPGQKWLCGPDATGATYVRADRVGDFEQNFMAGGMVYGSLDYYGGSFQPAAGAARFDTAGRNANLLIGQETSTRWITDELGVEWVTDRIEKMAKYTYEKLEKTKGVTLVTPKEALAGLIAFNVDGISGPDLSARMAEEFNVTIRYVTKYINNPEAARVSLGFYNNEEDVEAFLDALKKIQASL